MQMSFIELKSIESAFYISIKEEHGTIFLYNFSSITLMVYTYTYIQLTYEDNIRCIQKEKKYSF